MAEPGLYRPRGTALYRGERADKMADTVWLARHGNRQDFVDREWPRTAERPFDPGLSLDGELQARQLAERLRPEPIEFLFASPFLRTVQTADYVAAALDVPIFVEPGIAEWMNPTWFPGMPETLPIEGLAERFPRIDLSYRAFGAPHYPENEREALARAGGTARSLAAAYPRQILLVGHGVSVAGAVSGFTPEAELRDCALCSLFKIVRNNGYWRLALCGDVSHLGPNAAAEPRLDPSERDGNAPS